jgi:hypothetical protein
MVGDFLDNFSLSLGNFFTKTSGHPVYYIGLYYSPRSRENFSLETSTRGDKSKNKANL